MIAKIISEVLKFLLGRMWDNFEKPTKVTNVETYLEKPVVQPKLQDILTKFDSIN